MCLISRYQIGYESAQQYNAEIAKHQLMAMVEVCFTQSSLMSQIAILGQFLEGGTDVGALGLIDGRFQYLQLQIMIDGHTETIEITTRVEGQEDGVWVKRASGQVESLAEFMHAHNIVSVAALLAISSNYQMIDPEIKTEKLKIITINKNELEVKITQGKIDYELGRVTGENAAKSQGKGNGFKTLGIVTDDAMISFLLNELNYIKDAEIKDNYWTKNDIKFHGTKYIIKRSDIINGYKLTIISAWQINDLTPNQIDFVSAYPTIFEKI